MSCTLLFGLLVMQMTPAVAGQGAGDEVPEGNDRCQMVSVSDSGNQGSESTPPTESCNPPDGELPDKARQGIVSEIAEGMQTAVSLESLLLGRNYVFFGRVGV